MKHGYHWKGGRTMQNGYVLIWLPNHPRSVGGYVLEHILVVEKAIGKHLPYGSMPHHVNGKKDDNRPENLVLCQDHAYHCFIHRRMRAYKACGHANWRKCWICKIWDPPEKVKIRFLKKGNVSYHVSCNRTYINNYYKKRTTA